MASASRTGCRRTTGRSADTRPPYSVNLAESRIRHKQILGGLTREYYVAA